MRIALAVVALAALRLAGPVTSPQTELTEQEVQRILTLSPLPPPPPDPTNRFADDERAARLGQAIFFDERFSRHGNLSCATCHDPELDWADGKQHGVGRGVLPRHTISLWNVAYNRWFFWDGRKDSLWSQALAPLEHPLEHDGSRLQYAHLIREDEDYRRAYESVFGEFPDLADTERFPERGRPMTGQPAHPLARAWNGMVASDRDVVDEVFANIGKALAAFQRKLVSRHSPFDTFVEGLRENDAEKLASLDASALRGLRLFMSKARCILCHDGPNFTDFEFHNDRVPPVLGEPDIGRFDGIAKVLEDPFNGLGRFSDEPRGEARNKLAYLLQIEHNKLELKTPTLRNASVTAPYMHEGQFESLADVLHFYSTLEGALPPHRGEKIVEPLRLSIDEQRDIVKFIESLADTALDPVLRKAPAKASLAGDR